MRKLSRKNQVEIGVMTVLFIIASYFVYQTTILPRMAMPRLETVARADRGKEFSISDGDHFEQTFQNKTDELLSAGIQISVNEDAVSDLVANQKNRDLGSLHIELQDEGGELLTQADYEVWTLADGQNLLASFPGTQTGWAEKQLTLVIDAEKIHEEAELAVGYTERAPEDSGLTVNGEARACALNARTATHQFFYWKKWAVIGAGLIYLLLLGTYFGLAVLHWKAERVFLLAGGLLSVLYLLLMPPMTVPDEYAHYKEAYYHSNRVTGKQAAGDMIVLELEDYEAARSLEYTPTLTEFDTIKEEIGRKGRKEGTTEQVSRYTQASALLYLPGIAGITLGRLLGLNGLLVIYLGRLFAMLLYLVTMYWFIRLMPFGKSFSFILAILPMTIQQCCSYSYDAMIIEAMFLYSALLFRLLYKKEPVRAGQAVLYALLVAFLAICKGGAYLPLCLLTAMIPASRFSPAGDSPGRSEEEPSSRSKEQGKSPSGKPLFGSAKQGKSPSGKPLFGSAKEGKSPLGEPLFGSAKQRKRPSGKPLFGSAKERKRPSGKPLFGSAKQGKSPSGKPLCHSARKRKWLFTGCIAVLAAAAFLSKTLSYVLYVAAPTAEQAEASYLGAEAYGMAGLLADPMNFICLSVRTLFLSGDGFLETMLGMQLGWLNIFVSRIAIYGWLLLLILSLLPVGDEKSKDGIVVTKWQKLAYILTAGMSIGMTFVSMYISWTPRNAQAIAGIQGRYFLPLLPVLLLVCYNKAVTIKRDYNRHFMFLAVCLQCVAIYGILLSLENVL